MFASVFIHEERKTCGVLGFYVLNCELASLSFLFLVLHGGSKSYGSNWFE
jgi:hypothetical protein